jgi:hypothetical protein
MVGVRVLYLFGQKNIGREKKNKQARRRQKCDAQIEQQQRTTTSTKCTKKKKTFSRQIKRQNTTTP